jgi:hypothetical protein
MVDQQKIALALTAVSAARTASDGLDPHRFAHRVRGLNAAEARKRPLHPITPKDQFYGLDNLSIGSTAHPATGV